MILIVSLSILLFKLLTPNSLYIVSGSIHVYRVLNVYTLSNSAMSIDIDSLELSDLEKRILETLMKNGGVMYQSDMVRALGVPKSTLSVTLARLEARG